jgi:hypothetical protein
MNAELILSRLRSFLLALSGCLFAGTLFELIFINHTKDPVQWIPFFLCGLGMLADGLAFFSPQRKSFLFLRASMALIALGSLVGMYEHISTNVAFKMEIQPGSTIPQIVTAGLGGAAPLLAPGILAVAAVLALAASYSHPALEKGREGIYVGEAVKTDR